MRQFRHLLRSTTLLCAIILVFLASCDSMLLVGFHDSDGSIWIPPSLSCLPIDRATAYVLEIDTDSTFTAPPYSLTRETNTVSLIGLDLVAGTWYYRFAPIINEEQKNWSDTGSFVVTAPSFSGRTPVTADHHDMTPTLSWSAVTDAAAYDLKTAETAAGLASASVIRVSSTTYDLPEVMVHGDTLAWRVRAVNQDGQVTPWSATASFTVAVAPGDSGPAGGLIFYMDTDDTYPGWDYLEAAPAGWSGEAEDPQYDWGTIPLDFQWEYWCTENANVLNPPDGTGVGDGADNTGIIIGVVDDENTAAWVCHNLVLGGYADWYLPSIDELAAMDEYLSQEGLGGFTSDAEAVVAARYWSSSYESWNSVHAMAQYRGFYSHSNSATLLNSSYSVRPVRRF